MINQQAVSDANRWGVVYQGHNQPTSKLFLMQTVGELFTKAMINQQALSDTNRWGVIYQDHDQSASDANR